MLIPGPILWVVGKFINTRSPETDKQANEKIGALANNNSATFTPWAKGRGLSISFSGEAATDTFDRYLISPAIRFPLNGVVMSYWISSTKNSDVNYSILVSSTGNTVDDFKSSNAEELYSEVFLADTNDRHNFTYKTVNLQSKIGDLFPNKVVYVAFKIKGINEKVKFAGVKLDDIVLEAIIPGCSYPTNIESTSINESSNLTLSWKSNATSFEVVYSDTMFNPLETPDIGRYLLNIPNNGLSGGTCIIDGLQSRKKILYMGKG